MKKIMAFMMCTLMLMSLAACGSAPAETTAAPTTAPAQGTEATDPAQTGASEYKPEDRMTCFAPYNVGGGVDVFGREMTAIMSQAGLVDVTWLYENVGGSSGRVGMTQIVEQHDGDETYILPAATAYLTTAFLDPELGGYSYKDVTMLCKLCNDYRVYVTPAASGIATMEALIETGKTRELVSAISGVAGMGEYGMGALSLAADIPVRCVPMDGSSAVTAAILGNQVDVAVMGIAECLPYVQDGTLIALAVAAPERLADLPDVRTTAECGLGDLIVNTSRGFIMPANVSEECKAFWIEVLRKLYESPEFDEYCKKNMNTKGWAEGDDYIAETENELNRMLEVFSKYGE